MSGTVGAYQVAPFVGPVPGFDVSTTQFHTRGNDNAIAKSFNQHDADGTIHLNRTTTTGVTTSAVAILAAVTGACWAVVSGSNGSGKIFVDVVVFALGGTPTALSSTSVLGAADARTYTVVAGVLKVAMAAGTYTVQVIPLTF